MRCSWAAGSPDYSEYHDREWGRPTDDDRWLFEKICLEGFQSGLSWLTILRKRENFRRAFANFDVRRVARFGAREVDRLLADAGIVRHRGKIASTINNAARARDLVAAEGTLASYVWGFEPAAAARPRPLDRATLMTMPKTPESIALSKDLKKRGWSFVGPTTMYTFMQSAGVVNDHLEGCLPRRGRAGEARLSAAAGHSGIEYRATTTVTLSFPPLTKARSTSRRHASSDLASRQEQIGDLGIPDHVGETVAAQQQAVTVGQPRSGRSRQPCGCGGRPARW